VSSATLSCKRITLVFDKNMRKIRTIDKENFVETPDVGDMAKPFNAGLTAA